MLLYRYLLHYGLLLHIIYQYLWLFSLLFYKVYHEEGECRQLEFWLEKEQTLETYSAQLQKSWNSTKVIFEINDKYSAEEIPEGDTHRSRGWGARPTPWARPLPCGPPVGPLVTILCYMDSFDGKKIISHLLRRNSAATRRNQSRVLAGLFCRGNFPPGGGNHRHRHHQRSSHRERAISINIFTSTISSQNPSSSLVSNSYVQVRDWYLWVASSVDYIL